MAISIKSIGGSFNEVPRITNLRVTKVENTSIQIAYHIEDVELSICRHYITVKTGTGTVINHLEITKEVGYEKSDVTYTIKNLRIGTNYTIQIFASDGNDEGKSDALSTSTPNVFIYGVRVDETNKNPETAVTYIEQAVGETPAKRGVSNYGSWMNKWPFNKIRIVGFKDNKVTKEINPENKKHYFGGEAVPDDVDIMVEIPKIYWKFTRTTTGYEIRISNGKPDTEYDCYAHKVNGKEKDFIYLGAFLAWNNSYPVGRARSQVTLRTYTNTIYDWRKIINEHNGPGWVLYPWYSYLLYQILFLIQFKSRDARKAFGPGCSAGGYGESPGRTFDKGMNFAGEDGREMCYLGVEDFYGITQFIDGIYCNGDKTVSIAPENTFTWDRSNYINIGKTYQYSVNVPLRVYGTSRAGFIPTADCGTGSRTEGYCDEPSFYASGYAATSGYETVFGVGGGRSEQGEYAGLPTRICYVGV